MIKYADDVTLLCPFRRDESISTIMDSESLNIKVWCSKHGLALNEEKTKIIVFSKPRISKDFPSCLPASLSSVKILGIVFNQSLNWNDHVLEVTKSASRRIHVLRKLKQIDSVTKQDLLIIYENSILCILEYNSPLFVAMSEKNKQMFEKIRKRCHRIICGLNCDCSDFPELSERRMDRAMKVFNQMQSPEHILNKLIPHKLPRTQHFFIEFLRSERVLDRSYLFVARCVRWNSFGRLDSHLWVTDSFFPQTCITPFFLLFSLLHTCAYFMFSSFKSFLSDSQRLSRLPRPCLL